MNGMLFIIFLWVFLGMLAGGLLLIRQRKPILGKSILTVLILLLAVPAAYLAIGIASLTLQAFLQVSPKRYVAVLGGIAALVICVPVSYTHLTLPTICSV